MENSSVRDKLFNFLPSAFVFFFFVNWNTACSFFSLLTSSYLWLTFILFASVTVT
jgi:hypothetical protein